MKKHQAIYDGPEPFAFVSYSHADQGEVYPEINGLQSQGFKLWYDEGIGAGSHWRDELAQRIRECSLFLFYASPDSFASRVCREELEYALDQDCTVLILYLEECTAPDGIAMAVSNRQALFRHKLLQSDY